MSKNKWKVNINLHITGKNDWIYNSRNKSAISELKLSDNYLNNLIFKLFIKILERSLIIIIFLTAKPQFIKKKRYLKYSFSNFYYILSYELYYQ